jgi:hypothetical protein
VCLLNHTTFFKPWETIHESNPREILERREAVTLVPLLIMQGALDDNVLPAVQEKFAATYKAAGGDCQYQSVRGLRTRMGRQTGAADGQNLVSSPRVDTTAACPARPSFL